MWECRSDNKKKLTPYAVPTIFGFFIKEKVKFEEATEKCLRNVFEKEHKLVHDEQVQNQDKGEEVSIDGNKTNKTLNIYI